MKRIQLSSSSGWQSLEVGSEQLQDDRVAIKIMITDLFWNPADKTEFKTISVQSTLALSQIVTDRNNESKLFKLISIHSDRTSDSLSIGGEDSRLLVKKKYKSNRFIVNASSFLISLDYVSSKLEVRWSGVLLI